MSGRLWWRQLRVDATAVLTLLVLLVGTSFLLAAGPRWLNEVSDDAVRSELRTSPEIDDVIATYSPVLAEGGRAAGDLLVVGDTVLASLQAPLPEVLGPAVVTASTTAAALLGANDVARDSELPSIDVALTALVAPTAAVRYVEGEAPAATTDQTAAFALLDPSLQPLTVRVVEVAMTEVSARAAGIALGDVLTVGGTAPVLVQVTGIFEPVDADAYVWSRHLDLLVDSPVYGLNGIESDTVSALVPPASLDALATALSTTPGQPGRVQADFSYPIVVDRVDAGMVADLRAAADRAESNPIDVFAGPLRVSSSVQAPLDDFVTQRSTAYAVLSIVIAGLAVSALTVLVLAARLITERRSAALALSRARGATLRQLVVGSAAEAAVVALSGTALGVGAAVVLVPARSSAATWWLCGFLVGATVLVLAAIVAAEHRTFRRGGRRDLAVDRRSPRRLAAEVGVVVLAAVGVLLLRQRGLTASVVDGSVDPYLVAVPVLVALATALVVLRLYPLPLRALSAAASQRRGLVGFLGLSRAGRETASTAAPIVVLLVGLSFAIFAAVVLHSVRVEQDLVSWQTVGAPLRVDGTDFDPSADLPAIAAAARISPSAVLGVHVEPTSLVRGPNGAPKFDLLLLDPAAYQAFVAAYPLDTAAFDLLRDAAGGAGSALPALVSPAMDAALHDNRSGNAAVHLIGATPVLHELGVLPSFGAFDADELWAIGRTTDADLVVDLPYWPSTLFLAAPDADRAEVLAAVQDRQPFSSVVSRSDVYAAVARAPLVQATATAFGLAVAITAGYCLVAVALSLVVAARPRSRFLSYLRTLGLSDRQARWLVGWEILPPAVVATLVGAVLGLALPRLLLPALELRAFTGGLDAPVVRTDGGTVAILTLGLLGVVTIAVLVTTTINRRRHLGAAIRVGESS